MDLTDINLTYKRLSCGPDDTGWKEMEIIFLVSDNNCVSSIVASLTPEHRTGLVVC